MAPTDQVGEIASRALCPSGYYYSGGYCYQYSSWYWWGRWVFAGVVIVFAIFLLAVCGCMSSRRRRRRGMRPLYGTGWMASQGKYGGPGYNQQQQNYAAPPPQYSQNAQYGAGNYQAPNGYYGAGHNEGVQLQQPQNAYYPRGGEEVYEPPAGPPPGK